MPVKINKFIHELYSRSSANCLPFFLLFVLIQHFAIALCPLSVYSHNNFMCNRYPFEGQDQYVPIRKTVLRLSIELASTAQRDQFVENPNEVIQTSCLTLAEICDRIVQEINDSLAIQSTALEVVTIRKKPNEDLGMHIHSSYSGIHIIGGIKFQSPCHRCGQINEGDEIVQINYQTVLGWQLKKLVNSMKEFPTEILLTIKKRPRHSNIFGSVIVVKPYKIPSMKTSYKSYGIGGNRRNNNNNNANQQLTHSPYVKIDFTRSSSESSVTSSNAPERKANKPKLTIAIPSNPESNNEQLSKTKSETPRTPIKVETPRTPVRTETPRQTPTCVAIAGRRRTSDVSSDKKSVETAINQHFSSNLIKAGRIRLEDTGDYNSNESSKVGPKRRTASVTSDKKSADTPVPPSTPTYCPNPIALPPRTDRLRSSGEHSSQPPKVPPPPPLNLNHVDKGSKQKCDSLPVTPKPINDRLCHLVQSLRAFQRTLTDKQHEIDAINDLLNGPITTEILEEWISQYPHLLLELFKFMPMPFTPTPLPRTKFNSEGKEQLQNKASLSSTSSNTSNNNNSSEKQNVMPTTPVRLDMSEISNSSQMGFRAGQSSPGSTTSDEIKNLYMARQRNPSNTPNYNSCDNTATKEEHLSVLDREYNRLYGNKSPREARPITPLKLNMPLGSRSPQTQPKQLSSPRSVSSQEIKDIYMSKQRKTSTSDYNSDERTQFAVRPHTPSSDNSMSSSSGVSSYYYSTDPKTNPDAMPCSSCEKVNSTSFSSKASFDTALSSPLVSTPASSVFESSQRSLMKSPTSPSLMNACNTSPISPKSSSKSPITKSSSFRFFSSPKLLKKFSTPKYQKERHFERQKDGTKVCDDSENDSNNKELKDLKEKPAKSKLFLGSPRLHRAFFGTKKSSESQTPTTPLSPTAYAKLQFPNSANCQPAQQSTKFSFDASHSSTDSMETPTLIPDNKPAKPHLTVVLPPVVPLSASESSQRTPGTPRKPPRGVGSRRPSNVSTDKTTIDAALNQHYSLNAIPPKSRSDTGEVLITQRQTSGSRRAANEKKFAEGVQHSYSTSAITSSKRDGSDTDEEWAKITKTIEEATMAIERSRMEKLRRVAHNPIYDEDLCHLVLNLRSLQRSISVSTIPFDILSSLSKYFLISV